ncbi:MAG: molybdenum cofactor guanylyltransferase MobA [Pseudomonadota bacterium]
MTIISSIILAGGRATRMNGVDKGLVQLQQKPLIQYVIERLATQVHEIIINANREIMQYQALGYPVLMDETADFIGPLAGISLGLKQAKYDYLLSVPCDSPLLPLDLAQRLHENLVKHGADIAVATSSGNAHPVFCLCKKNVLPSLTRYLQQGGRKVSAWQKSLNYIEVNFDDSAEAFINLNTFADLAALELQLKSSHG